MKAARGRSAVLLCWASITAVLATGCTVGRKSFSMDSTSRMPFFGFELKERGPKPPDPKYSSISRSSTGVTRVQVLLHSSSATSRKSDGQLIATNDVIAGSNPVPSQASIDETKPPVITSIPLQMTEPRREPTDAAFSSRNIDSLNIDFQ